MNGIYIEYSKLTPYHIDWLDGCGAKWACLLKLSDWGVTNKFLGYNACHEDSFIQDTEDWFTNRAYTHCQTADEFCQGIAERLGIIYTKSREEIEELLGVVQDPKEEKYQHVRNYLEVLGVQRPVDANIEELIRAVLADLPQEWVREHNGHHYRLTKFVDTQVLGVIYQRIGSISEKAEIVREGFV